MSPKDGNIFEADELILNVARGQMSLDELLAKEGLFFLKDIAGILEIESEAIKKKARELSSRGQSPWEVMGTRKIWNHWMIRMKLFAPYYREHFVSKVRSIPVDMSGNTLLEQRGIYYMAQVCRLLPFSMQQLRYQSKKNPRTREEFGVWKDEELNAFLVDMEVFAPWINEVWSGGFQKKKRARNKPGR